MRAILCIAVFLTACNHEKEGFLHLQRVPDEPNEATTDYQLMRESEHENLKQNERSVENKKE